MDDKKKKIWKDILDIVVSVTVIVFILFNFIIMPCMVHGTSMYPTLIDEQMGYSLVITKNIKINRFDICVLDVEGVEDKLLVKRVIGLPNETIEYKDNRLYVNGEYIEETFLNDAHTNDFKVVLGEDEYYCLGDNRSSSRDSRYYGSFSKKNFKATHFIAIYPFDKVGYKK